MNYVRITKGLVDNGILALPEKVKFKLTDPKQDYYQSTFYYTEEQYKKFQETKTIKGIKEVKTNKLWWDFDDKNDLELVRKDTLTLLDRLKSYIDPDKTEIYFSGNKGFNILLTVDKELSPSQVKQICLEQFGKDLKTLDHSMYDSSQLLRIPNTINKNSNLYKIPLRYDELKDWSIDSVKENAKSMRSFPHVRINATFPEDFYTIPKEEKKPVVLEELDLNKKPSHWKLHKWAIAQGFFEKGERHEALMILASTCKALGYDKLMAYYLCKNALYKSQERYGEGSTDKSEVWNDIIGSVYSDDWEGGQYALKDTPLLQKICDRLGIKEEKDEVKIITIDALTDNFKTYVTNIEQNTIKLGLSSLDNKVFISTGANVGILGAAGSAKSSLAINILNNTSNDNVDSVFASLDMAANRMYEKIMYKLSGMNRYDLYQTFRDNKEGPLVEKLKQEFGNVNFLHKSNPTVEDLRNYILRCEDEKGRKIKLVMVDYFERLSSDFSDENQASKRVAGELQDLVNDLDIALVTLVQPNKMGISNGADKPIYDYTKIKGSSFLYQSFRIILSIWRPFYNPQDFSKDNYLQMAVLKNDLGELGEFQFGWNGAKGDISELTPKERQTLFYLLDEKKKAEEEEKGNSGWD